MDRGRGQQDADENSREHTGPGAKNSLEVDLANDSIARDLADEDVPEPSNAIAEHALSRTSTNNPAVTEHSLATSFTRTSHIASGPRPFLGLGAQHTVPVIPAEHDVAAAVDEERDLLLDNHIIRPPEQRRSSHNSAKSQPRSLKQRISFSTFSPTRHRLETQDEEAAIDVPEEATALLGPHSWADSTPTIPDDAASIAKTWEDAVLNNAIQTTWRREARTLFGYAWPLCITFILQNSLTLTSVFVVGHIGKIELGAISLGAMTANITGYAVYHGLATSLDTLCAQAYGSGKKTLVGLNLQRMVLFLWTITIPIGCVWFFGGHILGRIVPEQEIAILAGRYLRVMIIGAPGYAAFESAKRYVQAQGRFTATLYVLLIAAPLNVLLHWLFVWKLQWGFIGCPIAIIITETLMPFLLALYVRFVGGLECWPGFTQAAFRNWGPMVRLALPGLVMVMAEFLAFEILTLASANFSATHLAANTVLQSLSVFTYNFPFPLSIAGSTRVANLIGASLPDAGKVTARVMFVGGAIIGIANMLVLSLGRNKVPWLFTNDAGVVELAAKTLPVNAAFQLFDSLAAQCNGVLRGLGKQSFGGMASLVAFYVVALPISFGLGFGLNWELFGLWAGPAIGLFVQSMVEGTFIFRTSWKKASEEAAARNAAG